MTQIEIYTDGACKGNPGPGGWGCTLSSGSHYKELSGGEPDTTNQRMELRAAVEGLRALKKPSQVRLHSDSAYLINAFKQGWLSNWQRNGWQTKAGKPVQNQDLWELLLDLTERHQVEWIKVRGHAGNEKNERCDELARQAAVKAAR